MSQLTVHLPDPVLSAARKLAEREKLSVEEFVAHIIAEAIRLDAFWEERVTRGRQISSAQFKEILSHAPDAEPDGNDRIE